jgi:hypothetical protein
VFAFLNTVRVEFDLQAGCRQLCVQVVSTCCVASGRPGLSKSNNGLPCSWRAPCRPWGQNAAQIPVDVGREKQWKQRRIVIPFLIPLCDSKGSEPRMAAHLGCSCSACSADFGTQLVISCSLSDIGIYLISRASMHGLDAAVHDGEPRNGEREAASQRTHCRHAQYAGNDEKRSAKVAVRSVRSSV